MNLYTDTCPGCHTALVADSIKRLQRKARLHADTCTKYQNWTRQLKARLN